MKNRFLTKLLGLSLALLATVSAVAQSLDNRGTDFIMAFNPNPLGDRTIQLHLTSDQATMVTVHYPVNAPTFTDTVAVNPGAITVVTLPDTASESWAGNSVQNNCVRAFSDNGVEFVCYQINVAPFTSDAGLALPIDTMNTAYIVADYNPITRSHFTVVAAFDNTTVTITPKAALVGRAANVPFNVTLNRGEGYHGLGVGGGAVNSLTGTLIESDRPVGLINGEQCANIPNGFTACDHIFEIAQPVASWGSEVLVANLPLRAQSVYRVLASQDDTMISLDGAFLANIDQGEFHEVTMPGDHVFSADKPIFVVQYMPGQSFPGGNNTGDPAMGNMIPSEQYLSHYTFATPGQNQFARNFVTVIARTLDVGSVLLDGVVIPAASFSIIPGSLFSVARVEIAQGTHNTSSPNPHGITVEGYNSFDSYIYPGGALFEFINPVGDANAPICAAEVQEGPPPAVCGTATDNRPSEDINNNNQLDPGEDLNNNGQIDKDTGIFFVQLAAGAVNLTLTVDAFTPGDGSAEWCVTLTDPNQSGSGAVVATDGAGNQCRVEINLSVGQGPTVRATSQRIASGYIVTLDATDDTTAPEDIALWILDAATPGFKAGPFSVGDRIVLRKNTKQAPYWRALTGYAAQVQTKGQARLVGEDEDGNMSAPVNIP